MFGSADTELTVENLAIVLVILAVVGPSEAGERPKSVSLMFPFASEQDGQDIEISII